MKRVVTQAQERAPTISRVAPPTTMPLRFGSKKVHGPLDSWVRGRTEVAG